MKKIYLFLICYSLLHAAVAQESGIINNSQSKYAVLKSINIGDCQWTEGFWADKFKICEESMIPYMGSLLCGDTGHALNNFKIAAGLKEGEHQGMNWHDGDFYKWIEAAMYVYAQNGDKKLLSQIDKHISIIAKAQQDNGYLQTQIQLKDELKPYTNRRTHEMYNSGHLLTSACIHHRVTGQDNFLNIAIKHADLMHEIFTNEDDELLGRFGFNQTQIMGLVELYRTTSDVKYLELAEIFINNRGKYSIDHNDATRGYPIGDMVQERTPLREANEAVGHAVLALYYYAGAADIYAETGESALLDALKRLWSDVTEKKMYVTGAVGQAHYGASTNRDLIQEGFIDAYNMPNTTAYNETCANICNSMFNYRMLSINGESKYADIMELVLYNSALSGISLEGKDYFYTNPLRMVHNTIDYEAKHNSTESPHREPYLRCFCCPPNLVRTIAKVSAWAYSLSQNGIAVNLYGGNKLSTTLLDGTTLKLRQVTQYPWAGGVKITIEEAKAGAFDLMLRIPDWAAGTEIYVNGEATNVDIIAGTFAIINRVWSAGDEIRIDMPMTADFVEANPRIEDLRNQVAVQRGPIVYCIESPDLPEDMNIHDVYIASDAPLKPAYKADLLGGVTAIETEVLIRKTAFDGMYHRLQAPPLSTIKTKLIPYYAWSNRQLAEMTVFMPIVWN